MDNNNSNEHNNGDDDDYEDAMFEKEDCGPTAVELAQKIINELESNDTMSLNELKNRIEGMETNMQLNINNVDGVDVTDNARDGKTLESQYEWNNSTRVPVVKTERDVSIINQAPDFYSFGVNDESSMITYDEIIKNSNEDNLGMKWNKSTLIYKARES